MFDTFIFCDWSASATPKTGRDSLWLCRARARRRAEVANPSTRTEAEALLARWLEEDAGRIFVGYDFPLGLPASAYAGLGFRGWREYWHYLADAIEDGPRNANNRFDVARTLNARTGLRCGPFWGAPVRAAYGALTSTKPASDPRFPDFREAERVLRARGRRPFSVWQLLGNGSVGSQSLVGIPMIERLRQRGDTKIWPFEAGPSRIIHAEAGPMAIEVDLARHPVRDAAQMLSLAAWAKRVDMRRWLEDVPPIARREGWCFGG